MKMSEHASELTARSHATVPCAKTGENNVERYGSDTSGGSATRGQQRHDWDAVRSETVRQREPSSENQAAGRSSSGRKSSEAVAITRGVGKPEMRGERTWNPWRGFCALREREIGRNRERGVYPTRLRWQSTHTYLRCGGDLFGTCNEKQATEKAME